MTDMAAKKLEPNSDYANYDTDGDCINYWFEIDVEKVDGIRGNGGSPIRYDDRTTS